MVAMVTMCLLQVWEGVHRLGGYGSLVIGIGAIYTGLKQIKPVASDLITGGYFGWVIATAIMFLSLEFLKRMRVHMASAQSPPGGAPASAASAVSPGSPTDSSKAGQSGMCTSSAGPLSGATQHGSDSVALAQHAQGRVQSAPSAACAADSDSGPVIVRVHTTDSISPPGRNTSSDTSLTVTAASQSEGSDTVEPMDGADNDTAHSTGM
jgi:hypothetical protein